MSLNFRTMVVAQPKYYAITATAENQSAVAAWCNMPELPLRADSGEPGEVGDVIVRPAAWDPERPGGFAYPATDFAQRFDLAPGSINA